MTDPFGMPTFVKVGKKKTPTRLGAPGNVRPPTEGAVGTRIDLACDIDSDGDATATITLPTYSSGDLVIVNLLIDDNIDTFTTPTGWNVGAGPYENQSTEVIYWRKMDGTEGSELSVTLSGTVQNAIAVSFVHRGLDYSTLTPDFSTLSTVANAPSVSFSHGSAVPYDVYVVVFDANSRPVTATEEDGYTELSDCAAGLSNGRVWLWHKRIAAGASAEDPNMQFAQSFADEFGVCTYAVAAETTVPDVASGDHTHLEADVTDLTHWTETDHDALDHTGLTGVGVSDHGALTGKSDDDHLQYLLAAGTRAATYLEVSGLTGATGISPRFVGGNASGAPASGTFELGDYVVNSDGSIYICTTAGTPGTWTAVTGGGGDYYEVIVAGSGASLEAVSNEAEDDWLYGLVP